MGLLAEGAALGATAYGYAQMLRPAIAFEAKMAEVGKVVDFDGKSGLADLGRDIQELVTSGAMPMAADGIADIVAAAAQASLIDEALPDAEKRRQLIEFAEAAGKMGVAFDISAEEAGKAMAVWRSQLGLTQAQTIQLGDAVNYLSNKMNASAGDVTEIIGRVGSFAKVAGMADAEVAALATAFRTAAPSPEIAATAMKRFTSTMTAGETMTKRQSAVMNRLSLDAVELAQRMRVDARGAIIDVMEALQTLPEYEQNAALSQLFGDEAVAAIAPMLGNLDNLKRAFELVADETAYAGAMQTEYEGVANTTAAKLVVFQNHLKRLSVGLHPILDQINELTAALQPFMVQLAEWMQANPEIIKAVALIAAGLFGLKAGFLAIRLVFQPIVGLFWMFKGVLGAVSWGMGAFSTMLGVLVKALSMARFAVINLGRAFLANPIAAAVAAIATAAYLIYKHWDTVGPYFRRLWDAVRNIFGGYIQFLTGIFTGDIRGAVEGLKRAWEGLSAFFGTIWDGIKGIFLAAWDQVIKPITDAFGVTDAIIAGWNAARDGIGAVLDWLSAKFAAFWAEVSPIIDALKWVSKPGSNPLARFTGAGRDQPHATPYTGGATGPILPPPILPDQSRAQGGSFFPGALLVGERGPEIRYESRSGYIANHNALRRMADLSRSINL
ncbi:MAG: phage tail tape measure protein, partial [Paracoccus sp. (in: a-proteobacteria)]|nr:phage tail tape measure protein [Paracoccus sp. (in: a-proteobacteria)]